jgi:hypothetical protein
MHACRWSTDATGAPPRLRHATGAAATPCGHACCDDGGGGNGWGRGRAQLQPASHGEQGAPTARPQAPHALGLRWLRMRCFRHAVWLHAAARPPYAPGACATLMSILLGGGGKRAISRVTTTLCCNPRQSVQLGRMASTCMLHSALQAALVCFCSIHTVRGPARIHVPPSVRPAMWPFRHTCMHMLRASADCTWRKERATRQC